MEEVDWLVIAGAALTRSEQEKLARWLGHLSGSAGWPKTPDRDVAPAMDEPSPAPLRVGSFVLDEELVGVLWGSRSQVDVRTVDAHVARLRKAQMVQGQGRVIEAVFWLPVPARACLGTFHNPFLMRSGVLS